MARYGQAFKERALAQLLSLEVAAVAVIARDVGVGAATLERWRSDAPSSPASERSWSAAARLEQFSLLSRR
jgi:transposase